MNKVNLILLCLFAGAMISCRSTNKACEMNENSMFVLIYNGSNTGVNDVDIFCMKKGNKKNQYLGSSDVQGRFYMKLEENTEYTIILKKEGYETITNNIKFKSMTGQYYKMYNTDELLELAEKNMDI